MATKNEPPTYMIGSFQDDYNIVFDLSPELFFQKPSSRYHIVKWNVDEQYFIAQNDTSNAYDFNLFTRVDWMQFEEMEPFTWGFCISAYKEPTLESAEAVKVVNRATPKTGCNGYPFSRMKPISD